MGYDTLEWSIVGDPIDLCVVSECQDVGVHVPFRRVWFHVVLESGNDYTIAAFQLPTGLWVVHCGKAVLDLQDLADMLKKS